MQSSGRMQNILTSSGPLIIVVPFNYHHREMSAALRLAHDLNLYHRLDSSIILSSEAVTASAETLNQGNVVAIGNDASLVLRQRGGPWTSAPSFSMLLAPEKSHGPPVLDRPGLGWSQQ
jgi:hypothetical protein